jgi:uncharacterized protein
MTIYPLSAVRALALHAQHLTQPEGLTAPSSPDALLKLVESLGAVQIDTLQMVRRSQYLVPWSRMGNYDPDDFDNLVYAPEQRRLFEGWLHAACILPLRDYHHQIPMHGYYSNYGSPWFRKWLAEPENRALIDEVRKRIRQAGEVRGQDFGGDGWKSGSWWNWKPAKIALEYLFMSGELMVAERVNFQRVYDLTERVLPIWVERLATTAGERDRYWVEMGARALGICTPDQAGDYTKRKITVSRPIVRKLIEEGALVVVQARLADGETHDLIVHRDRLAHLQQAAEGAIQAQRTTFLSPFDNLFWAFERDRMFWDFDKRIEMYIPAPKRQWGYFCLPILYQDRLVGRFDPKLERKRGALRIKALYLEPGVMPDEALVSAVARAMTDFLVFHQAIDLEIQTSHPTEFGEKLMAAM